MSKAVTEKQDGQFPPGGRGAEVGPSLMKEDGPVFLRVCGLFGAVFAIIGAAVLLMAAYGKIVALTPGWAAMLLLVGVAGMLFHAATDKDVQFRLLYLVVGAGVVGVGILLSLLPEHQFAAGFICLLLGLMFTLAVLRNETEPLMRNIAQWSLLGVGAALTLTGLVGLLFFKGEVFPTAIGLVVALVGLVYAVSFIGSRGVSDTWAYRVGLILAAVGLLEFLYAVGRSTLPALFHQWKWMSDSPQEFFVPYGVAHMIIGVSFFLAAVMACSDNHLVVLTRRDLGTFFYSPMAYLVLLAFTVAAWLFFFFFFIELNAKNQAGQSVAHPEPIVAGFVVSVWAVITMIFVIPVLTMRLLSEEKRSGTLEVLLTAPVEEWTVVLSKFLAGLVMYLVVWSPFAVFLVVLWIGGGPFDYRPLICFFIGLLVSGMGFISMGLFFSSWNRNQLVSGVLTFVGMLILTMIYVFKRILPSLFPQMGAETSGFLDAVLNHMSYIDIWDEAMQGRLLPAVLVFWVSMTIFFLFGTVKVLEARKWI
jgi:ABC-type transport system involved in multi-copper enzyme maturation permease subunit